MKVLLIRAPGHGVGGNHIATLTGWFYALYVDDKTDSIKVKDFHGTVYDVPLEHVKMHKKEEATA